MSRRKQASFLAQLQRGCEWAVAATQASTNIDEVEERIAYLRTLHEKAMVEQDDIDEITGPNEIEQQYIVRGQMDEFFFAGIKQLRILQGRFRNAGAQQSSSSAAAAAAATIRHELPIPEVPLPTFNGDYKGWTPFKNLFDSLVDGRASLSGSQKMHLLKSHLRGDAAQLLQSLQISDDNYAEATRILENRYDNKRFIIEDHLRTFTSSPKIQDESASAIKKLHDVIIETTRALTVLAVPVNHWDLILIFIAVEKLDHDSRRHWEMQMTRERLPTLKQLTDFLDNRWQALEMMPKKQQSKQSVGTSALNKKSNVRAMISESNASSQSEKSCPICDGSHNPFNCESFIALDIDGRIKLLADANRCYNCLRTGHRSPVCPSNKRCQTCKSKHHTLIHQRYANSPKGVCVTTTTSNSAEHQISTNVPNSTVPTTSSSTTLTSSTVYTNESPRSAVLLATAMVLVRGANNSCHRLRALLDSASDSCFVTDAAVKRLQIESKPTSMSISGIGHTDAGKSFSKVVLFLFSRHDPKFALTVNALTIPKITGKLPAQHISHERWQHLQNIPLADPQYHVPKSVDLLLGADILGLCLRDGQLASDNGSPFALNTAFGYILFGQIEIQSSSHIRSLTGCTSLDECDTQERSLDTLLRSFWEIEELSSNRFHTPSEQQCEEHFQQTHLRTEDGRFVVALPFSASAQPLGDSRLSASIRLHQLERRFRSSPELKSLYVEFMRDYEDQRHMELIDPSERNRPNTYYLPHHGVMKSSSTTTKLRVVFDASNRTTTGISLNDNLLTGPKVQHDITSIVIRWRAHKFVLMADVRQMYRQIRVASGDCDFQRILWRESESEPVRDYRLLTVTYGTSAAPFLAIRCLQQLASDASSEYSLAANAILNETYVDDIMTGASDYNTLISLKDQLNELLYSAKLELRKWSSNNDQFLNTIPIAHRLQQQSRDLSFGEQVKALGIIWDPETDEFSIRVNLKPIDKETTKRSILSDTAKLYDPLGWLSPSIIVAKKLLQDLWQQGTGWDDPLPYKIVQRWSAFREQLAMLQQIRIPRWFGGVANEFVELHGFCDASTLAYAAVVYARVIRPAGEVIVSIVSSKTKVAPIKTVSLPRLELCGALLVAKLLESIRTALYQTETRTFAWSDSQVALGWLRGNPNRWRPFVANRVTEAINLVAPSSWKYISTHDNPADCASRGLTPLQLKSFTKWWSGPEWLRLPVDRWPQYRFNEIDIDKLPESRRVQVYALAARVTNDGLTYLLEKYSSLRTLQRVTAWCNRFCINARLPKSQRHVGELTASEMHGALTYWVKETQSVGFPDEINCCLNKTDVADKSRLRPLHPHIDALGVLRVGGRLANSHLNPEAKYPIILPKYSPLTNLIIAQTHTQTFHGGSSIMLAQLHRSFWILGAKSLVRRYVHNCTTCARYSSKCFSQLMGQLPATRVTPSRPFLNTGVDYAGPISIKASRLRNATSTKGYIAVFVCLATKALHLELASDLSTNAFLAAYKRFTARRGKCAHMFSDNGTNFVGADRELSSLLQSAITDNNSVIARHFASDGTDWSFIPPASPHLGGLWEAGVKSVKNHLRKILGNARLTFEEFSTVLAQIEACLNSRPLCPMTDDPADCDALTPGHFLIGEALTTVPHPNLTDINMNRLDRWQLVQRLYQHFWRQWSDEYLRKLQSRPKWTGTKPNISVGQLVLVTHENTAPAKWPLARVVATRPGKDGLVRVAVLKCGDSAIERAITKLRPLPVIATCSPDVLQGGEYVENNPN